MLVEILESFKSFELPSTLVQETKIGYAAAKVGRAGV
jgi:hypothetical protein